MSIQHRLLTTLLIIFVISFVGCSKQPTEVENVEPGLKSVLDISGLSGQFPEGQALKDDDEDPVIVKGKAKTNYVTLNLDIWGATEVFSFEANLEDGEVEGSFHVVDIDPVTGIPFVELGGVVTCVAFEDDGHTARLGGIVTEGDFIGTTAVWIVLDTNDDFLPDECTDLRYQQNEAVLEYHCEVGFSVEAFGLEFFGSDINPETGLFITQPESDEIEVELEIE